MVTVEVSDGRGEPFVWAFRAMDEEPETWQEGSLAHVGTQEWVTEYSLAHEQSIIMEQCCDPNNLCILADWNLECIFGNPDPGEKIFPPVP